MSQFRNTAGHQETGRRDELEKKGRRKEEAPEGEKRWAGRGESNGG